MGVQSVAGTANQAATLLRQPVETVGNRQITNNGAGPNAVGANLRETTLAARQNFINEASAKTAYYTGIGGIINAPVGAPEATQNIRNLTAPNSRAPDVMRFLSGPSR